MDLAIIAIVNGPMLIAMGWLFWNIRNINMKLEQVLSEDRVRLLLSDKLEIVEAKQHMLETRLNKVDDKLDRILVGIERIRGERNEYKI